VKQLILISIILLSNLFGCASSNITTKHADGKLIDCQASYFSLFKDIDGVTMSACGGKGSAAVSKVNTVLLQELFKALMSAAIVP